MQQTGCILIQFLLGVRLYQGVLNRTIPNYAMIAGRDFGDRDAGTSSGGSLDGINDGVWCQSAMNISGIGSWKLPNGSAVPDNLNAVPVHMANRPGQVGLLRKGSIGGSPYQGMYTCTIPDENGVNQALVVWAAGNPAYDGSNVNCEFKISLHNFRKEGELALCNNTTTWNLFYYLTLSVTLFNGSKVIVNPAEVKQDSYFMHILSGFA